MVEAAEMLPAAAFKEDRQAQAVPGFGAERTGGPVVAQPVRENQYAAGRPIAYP